jgi:uncharacterized protein YdaL
MAGAFAGVVLSLALAQAGAAAPRKCAQIYYDAAPRVSPRYLYGRSHALELQNLLGHFPDVQQYVIPIERYEKGQLERCRTSFYLGTYFDNPVPAQFLADFAVSSRTVVWAGYNVWQLAPRTQERLWGARFTRLSTLDTERRDPRGRPTFYRRFEYKGQVFEKYGEFDPKDRTRFHAAHEISLFELKSSSAVLAWAVHDGTGERAPYVLAAAKRWYVGDSPFSYISESDRYLIFADLLFDMLGEPPRRPPGAKKPALFRIEDAHPMIATWQLYSLADFLAEEGVPFSVAVIPLWVDPLGALRLSRKWLLAAENPSFLAFLRWAAAHGGSFILHGVTHQRGMARNPFTGMSGDDFEFWDRVKNRPPADDAEGDVRDRVLDGLRLLREAGIRPAAWMTPHYQASALDYGVFARLFAWSVGRIIYFPPGAPADALPTGQFYPYEIFGDVYGQRVVPENVGNVQPYMNEQVLKTVSVDDMVRILRRNAVLRDAWASFFVHPSMVDTTAKGGTASEPGDASEIGRLLAAARENGYEFIDLASWIKAQPKRLRPEPVEVAP